MEKNQILITVSKDKKAITIETEKYGSKSYSSCPNKVLENLQNAINTYARETKLEETLEFSNEGCYFKGGYSSDCKDCN